MLASRELGIGAHVASQIDNIDMAEFACEHLAETVERPALNKRPVGNKRNNAASVEPIHCPTVKPRVHIIHLGLLRRALLDERILDPLVDVGVFAVLVIVIFVHLVGVVRRVADNDRYLLFVLALYPRSILGGQRKEVARAAVFLHIARRQRMVECLGIVERIGKAEALKLLVPAHLLFVGVFYIQIGDIIRQYRYLVGVHLMLVFVREASLGQIVDNVADERAGTGSRIEYLHAAVVEPFAEMQVQEVVGALDHEFDRLIGRIYHTEAVGSFGIVAFVKYLIDHFQKLLLLVVIGYLRRSRIDRLVIMLYRPQRNPFNVAFEKCLYYHLQLTGDIILAVELRFAKDTIEDVLREYMLQHHFADILAGNTGIDALLADVPKCGFGNDKRPVGCLLFQYQRAQRLRHLGDVLLEQLYRLMERAYMRRAVTDKRGNEPVERLRVRHRHAHTFIAALYQYRRAAVLKEDVILRVAFGKFLPYLNVEVIGFVFALPISPVLDERIFEHTVGAHRTAF